MPIYITRETLRRLTVEVKALEHRLREQGKIVRQAIESGGGTHDNGMYDAAIHEQAVLAAKLERINNYLLDPSVIEDLRGTANSVTVGKVVVLENIETGAKSSYALLGPADVECGLRGAISYLSPLAQQVLGKKLGDVVRISVPNGEYEAEVVKILQYHADGSEG